MTSDVLTDNLVTPTLTNTNSNLFSNSQQIVSLHNRYWQQTGACSHPPYFDLTQHLSLSAPQDLSAPLHLFTSHASFHLSTHHSSLYLWPNTQSHQLHTSSNSLSSPFQHHYIFFFQILLPLSSHPPRLSLPPQSVYLCLKPSYPSLWLTHPPCYFAVPTACTERKRRYYPPIWPHSHLSVLSAGVSTSLCLAICGAKIKTLGFQKLICFNNTLFTLKD